jgi:hypothetical protein
MAPEIPMPDRIYLLRRVGHVGAYPLPAADRLTVSKGVITADVFDDFARQDHVQRVPSRKLMVANVRSIVAGKGDDDHVLQAGDAAMV